MLFVRDTESDYPHEPVLANYIVESDPIIQKAIWSDKPFIWSDSDRVKRPRGPATTDPQASNLSTLGFTVPIHQTEIRRAMLTVHKTGDPKSWRSEVDRCASTLILACHVIHSKAPSDLSRQQISVPLSRRELECLEWAAQGKDASTISFILGISEHTGRSYLKAARTKLGCATITQAVYVATKMGMIDL